MLTACRRNAFAAVPVKLLGSTVFAEADGPDFYWVKDVASDDVLNIRSEPTASTQSSARFHRTPMACATLAAEVARASTTGYR